MSAVETNQTAATVPPAYKRDFKIGQRARIVDNPKSILYGKCGVISDGPYVDGFFLVTLDGEDFSRTFHKSIFEFESPSPEEALKACRDALQLAYTALTQDQSGYEYNYIVDQVFNALTLADQVMPK